MIRHWAVAFLVILALSAGVVSGVVAPGDVTTRPTTQASEEDLSFPKIDRRPPVANWRLPHLSALPRFDRVTCGNHDPHRSGWIELID